MLNKLQVKMANVRQYPTIAISIVGALTLSILAIYSMIPADWLAAEGAFPHQWVRSLFGIIMMLPAIPILYWNIKDDLSTYLLKEGRTRKPLFWMGVSFFYLAAYRALWAGLFPPLWLLYLAEGLIIMIVWMGVKR